MIALLSDIGIAINIAINVVMLIAIIAYLLDR